MRFYTAPGHNFWAFGPEGVQKNKNQNIMGKIIFWLFVILLVVVVANAVFTESVKVGGWPWSSAEPEKKEEVKKAETCSPITEREMMAIKNISNPCPLNDTNKKVIDCIVG